MKYSLAAKVASEAIGTGFVICVGESVLANELLAKTKGKGQMGFGWVSLAFGLSFFPPISIFGGISATLNPAVVMAKLILGEIGFVEFLALCGAQTLGAFIGAILVWLLYLPHFKSAPEPPTKDISDYMLRTRDCAHESNLAISSYNTQKSLHAGFAAGLKDLWAYLSPGQIPGPHQALEESRKSAPDTAACSLHIPPLHLGQVTKSKVNTALPHTIDQSSLEDDDSGDQNLQLQVAAVIADQNAKLSVFATRPAINSPFCNLWAECCATAILVTGSELLARAQDDMDMTARSLYSPVLEGLIIGIFVFVVIAGLGGATGPAINPARDFGPRLAHWLLPISGKGTSEWPYAWVPVIGGLLGGAASAGLLCVIIRLKQSGA